MLETSSSSHSQRRVARSRASTLSERQDATALIDRSDATATASSHAASPHADTKSALGYKLRNQYERNTIFITQLLQRPNTHLSPLKLCPRNLNIK